MSTPGNYSGPDTDRYDPDDDGWDDFAMQSAEQFLEAQADRDYRRHCALRHGGHDCDCSPVPVDGRYDLEPPF